MLDVGFKVMHRYYRGLASLLRLSTSAPAISKKVFLGAQTLHRQIVFPVITNWVHTTVPNMSSNEDSSAVRKIGVVQMTCTADKDSNFSQAKTLIQRAKILGAEVVFLPECLDYVSESQQLATEHAEKIDGATVTKYQDLARSFGVWLSLGGFHEMPEVQPPHDGKVRIYNTHLIIDSRGDIKGKYSKTHLFNVDIAGKVRLQETDFAIPGTTIGPPVDTPVGKIGMAICYDLRFPELSIALAQQGADILTYPSAFTVPTGKAHWETLLKCRAIETQCYVVAAAQTGQHNSKRASYGHSLVVDPWGTVKAEIPEKADVVVTDIDLTKLQKVRQEMPVWQHRRPDLYGSISVTSNVPIDSVAEYAFGQVKVPSSVVFYRTALSYAFVNRKPVVPGHALVSPVRPVARFTDLTASEVADLFQTAQKVAKVVESVHGVSSLTCAIQDGPDAGQTIEHVHIHILPRKAGDFKKNDDVYYELDSNDKKSEESPWRTTDDMASEASLLRPHFT